MNTEKKKSGKLKKAVIAIIAILVILFIIGSFAGGEADEASQNIEETTGIDERRDLEPESRETEGTTQEDIRATEVEQINDTRHQIGETVTFLADNGGEINVTLTDWGYTYSELTGTVLYVSYMIENVGKESVTVGTGLFDVYADDYSIGKTWIPDKADASNATLSGGRKTNGTFCAEINPDNAAVIEVECGGSVFVLKDESMVVNRSAVTLEESGLGSVDIPLDIKADKEAIESYELSGRYGASTGQSVLDVSIYSSPEDDAIGNAEVITYYGEMVEVAMNVYQVATDTGEEVLLAASTTDGVITMQLYVDGQFIEEYLMIEHYES